MDESQILQQVGRQGWKVVGRRPEMANTTELNANNREVTVSKPTGNTVWLISGPGGQNDEITVKESTPGASGTTAVGETIPWQTDPATGQPPAVKSGFTLIQGPQKNLAQPQAAAGWTDVRTIVDKGLTYQYGKDPADGQFKKIPGVPQGTDASAPKVAPSAPTDWKPLKDDSGRTVAMYDPATGDRQAVTQPAQDKNVAAGSKKQTIENSRVITWTADGQGNWNVDTIGQPIADPNKPVEGATRRNVQGGMAVTEKYSGGQWTIDPTVKPVPFDPNAPKEGDVRPNTDNKGQAIQEVYRGGNWVTDTSVEPKPFGTKPPEVINTGTAPKFALRDPTTGAITWQENQATTDVKAQVDQLQEKARAERDRINELPLPPEDKAAQFNTWWAQNVQPAADQLHATAAQQDYANQRNYYADQTTIANNEATYEKSRQDTALTAGRQAVTDTLSSLKYRVGPTFGAEFSKALGVLSGGGGKVNFSPSAFTYDMPNMDQIAEQATSRALAHISPYAAYKVGAPVPVPPKAVDPAAALNATNYTFGGAPAAPTTTIAPDGTVTIQHQAPNPLASGGLGPVAGMPQ